MKRFSQIRRTQRTHKGAFRAEILSERDPERERCERELLDGGVRLPLPHRTVWSRSKPSGASWFVVVRDRRGNQPVTGYTVEVRRSRALPGHIILSARRFGSSANGMAQSTGLLALQRLAREHPNVVRVDLELFSREQRVRSALCLTASALGFKPDERGGGYENTVVIDLTPPSDEIFASFHATARRHIRAVDKRPISVHPIADPALAYRMDQLCRETMSRTCGQYHRADWERLISLSRQHPDSVRVVGTFRDDRDDAEGLVAFAVGLLHGDHVEYSTAASTRAPDLKVPLAYGLVWDLVQWGKAYGADWFDFGGVTAGSAGDKQDPLGGISDFKRYFSKHTVRVCDHWVYEPNPVRAWVANKVVEMAEWGMARAQSFGKDPKLTAP